MYLKRKRLVLKDVIIFRNKDDQTDIGKKKILASHIIYPQIKVCLINLCSHVLMKRKILGIETVFFLQCLRV